MINPNDVEAAADQYVREIAGPLPIGADPYSTPVTVVPGELHGLLVSAIGRGIALARRDARQPDPPTPVTAQATHRFAGSNTDRQSVGLPGHCDRCARVGHVLAHPTMGCGDVGCYHGHDPDDQRRPS